MSLAARLLNSWLRLTEKPRLSRATAPARLRRDFERKARLFFHPPRGTAFDRHPVAGRAATHVRARGVKQGDGPVILYFHGGGYVFGSPRTHRAMLASLSQLTGLPACLPDYRKAPEHPFPAAAEDALAAYRALQGHPRGVILGGDSAGGGLALALLHEILRRDLPKPLGCFLFSPLTDLTFSGESVHTNAAADVMLPASRSGEMVERYLSGHPPDTPLASPLFGEFTGAPPVWVTVGDTEILLDDSRRMADRLRAQGVDVTDTVEHDLPHVWPLFHNTLPEARATLAALAGWITALSPRSGDS